MNEQIPNFNVIDGEAIRKTIEASRSEILELVKESYLLHHDKKSVNPDSYFLRFPSKPNSRIIALPAFIDGNFNVAGIKWISSFPDNVNKGIARASALLILNDFNTGYPFACLESSLISATRTAASATLAAEYLLNNGKQTAHVSIVGNGIIAKHIVNFFIDCKWNIEKLHLFDSNKKSSEGLKRIVESNFKGNIIIEDTLEKAVRKSELIIFTTTANVPYVSDFSLFKHNPVILNISLRDLSPEIILQSWNFFDDVEHCMKAETSPHLAEKLIGNRSFVTGTIAEVINKNVKIKNDKPIIFSPFGLGILDIALGKNIYDKVVNSSSRTRVENFFSDVDRW